MFKKTLLLLLIFIKLVTGAFAQQEEKDFAIADSLLKNNQFAVSIARLDNLISKYGEKEKYLTTRGYAYMQLNDAVKAKADYQRAITLNPNCSKCLGNLSIIEIDNGNYALALIYLDQYIKLEPNNSLGYVKKGEAKFQLGNYDEAINNLNKGLTLEPNSPYIYLWLSMTRLAQHDAKSALDYANRSIQYQPNAEYVYFVRSKCYIELQQYQLAWDDVLSCLKKNPTFSEYHTYAGIILHQLNQPSKAKQAFDESIRLAPDNYLPYLQRSYLFYDAGMFDEACTDKIKAKTLLAAGSKEPGIIKQLLEEIDDYCNAGNANYYINKGKILFNIGQFETAAKVLDEGFAKFKTSPALLNSRGNAAMARGNFKQALENYRACLQCISKLDAHSLTTAQNPDEKIAAAFFSSELYNSISFAQANLSNFDSAIINLSMSIKILNDNPGIYEQHFIVAEYLAKRSTFSVALKKYTEADKDITEALRINPKCITALVNRATMLINKNTIELNTVKDLTPIFQPDSLQRQRFAYHTAASKDWKEADILAAIKDCDEVISYDPNNAMAYLRRAQANIILKRTAYCDDVLKAMRLGIKEAPAMLGVDCK
jgi:tetratricopeptide (TPR) repeat protein